MSVFNGLESSGPRRLIRDQAHDAIRDAILAGVLEPGEQLDDAELQRWLGISRTPIRQALFALTLEGFVETAPQAHTRVVKPRSEEAEQYLEAVGVLIAGVTNASIRVADADQRAGVVARLRDALTGIDEHNMDTYAARMTDYYLEVRAICPNRSLLEAVDHSARSLGYKVLVALKTKPIAWVALTEHHHRLLSAWEAGSPEAVEIATRRLFGGNPFESAA
ncbi:GntR family transcriptional regulator [Leifsonia sp. NPDC056824]|uniref:GntR family transcriptional regulator n=1 Tax=Leifsonia sp. NPDC056824 TaxID=3345953 RepID=UPI00368C7581